MSPYKILLATFSVVVLAAQSGLSADTNCPCEGDDRSCSQIPDQGSRDKKEVTAAILISVYCQNVPLTKTYPYGKSKRTPIEKSKRTPVISHNVPPCFHIILTFY